MNAQLERFARQTLKAGLAQLPEGHQRTFKLMYARGKINRGISERTVEESVAVPINQCVDEMPVEKLDWAMEQVSRSISKLTVASA